MSANYTHIPLLWDDSIRVLELHPALNPDDELECTLTTASLHDEPLPKYSALSYCWEAQVPQVSVRCGGSRILKITHNCFAALRALREPHETVSLWVDSVCIDQSNLFERSAQVAIMGEIYRCAERVLVWLGEWDAPLQRAVYAIRDIGYDLKGSFESEEELMSFRQQLRTKAEALKKSFSKPEADPLRPLFTKPWFSRIWPVQETALAAGRSIIIYGGKTPDICLNWWVLITAAENLRIVGYRNADLDKAMRLQKHLSVMVAIARFPHLQSAWNAKNTDPDSHYVVEQVFVSSREKGATDPRDKIFALHNIFQELEVEMPRPDYTKSVADVFREATIVCIDVDQRLNVLYSAPSDDRDCRPELPSWVPDWSDPSWAQTISDLRAATFKTSFHASASATPSWRFSSDGRTLFVSARMLGRITNCGQPFSIAKVNSYSKEESTHNLTKATAALLSWAAMAKQTMLPHDTGNESLSHIFCRTIFQDNADEAETPSHQFDDYYTFISCSKLGMIGDVVDNEQGETHASHHPSHHISDNNRCQQSGPSLVDASSLAPIHIAEELRLIHYMVMVYANRQTFFVTDDNRTGLAPAVLRAGRPENLIMPGDRIAIISGLSMPFVVRPVDVDTNDSLYRLVTHTYIHGIMYSEAWNDESALIEEIGLA